MAVKEVICITVGIEGHPLGLKFEGPLQKMVPRQPSSAEAAWSGSTLTRAGVERDWQGAYRAVRVADSERGCRVGELIVLFGGHKHCPIGFHK